MKNSSRSASAMSPGGGAGSTSPMNRLGGQRFRLPPGLRSARWGRR
ncbi:hypothetical protein I553_2677 [Mycobacterium xenopi 4042]|uniref:Uncharacterized protein n=1 Tax=Mycobacterium xenopi 4042 TaxID=1299334 RepID=X7Z200_MYCXE|nr:hypothetical protein I553_2677 [Mycobacterium xenopi 4042]